MQIFRWRNLVNMIETFHTVDLRVSASTIVDASRLFEFEEIRKKWLEPKAPFYALHHASMVGSKKHSQALT